MKIQIARNASDGNDEVTYQEMEDAIKLDVR